MQKTVMGADGKPHYVMDGAAVFQKRTPVALVRHGEAFVETIRGVAVPGKAGDFTTVTVNDDGSETFGVLDAVIRGSTYAATPAGADGKGRPLFKKTAPVIAVRHTGDPVEIDTLEGPMTIRDGDWVLEGPAGDQWPREHAYVERHYEPHASIDVLAFREEQARLRAKETADIAQAAITDQLAVGPLPDVEPPFVRVADGEGRVGDLGDALSSSQATRFDRVVADLDGEALGSPVDEPQGVPVHDIGHTGREPGAGLAM